MNMCVTRRVVTIFSNRLFAPTLDEGNRAEAYSIHQAERSWDASVKGRYAIKLREMITEDIEPVVPPGSLFILVDKSLGLEASAGRRYVPFPERDGIWNGYPSDDEAAIAEMERLRRGGASDVLLAGPPGLRKFLQTEERTLVNNDRALIYELRI
jgi:hypothetical protein